MSLLKGAQLMKYAVWVLILERDIVLCCNKMSNTAMFLCIVYITLQNWNKFGCFSSAFLHKWRERKKVLRVLASDYVEKVSSFYVCSICLQNCYLNLKNEKEWQTEGRIPLEMCLEINVYSFIYKNKQWTSSIFSKISIYLATRVNLLHKVGRVFVFK